MFVDLIPKPLMQSPGILAQMYNSNKIVYRKMELSDLYKVLADLDHRHDVAPKPFVIQTGRIGMHLTSIAVEAASIGLRYSTYVPSRVPGLIVISLFKKHGLCKINYRMEGGKYKYHCVYGGTVVGKSSDLRSAVEYLKPYHNE